MMSPSEVATMRVASAAHLGIVWRADPAHPDRKKCPHEVALTLTMSVGTLVELALTHDLAHELGRKLRAALPKGTTWVHGMRVETLQSPDEPGQVMLLLCCWVNGPGYGAVGTVTKGEGTKFTTGSL